jgi:ATP-dependent protease Clp ATPase subunit
MVAVTTCCFCKRSLEQVTHLIQGPEHLICDICVDACIDTLATKDAGWRERQIDYLLRLRQGRSQAEQPPGRPGPTSS